MELAIIITASILVGLAIVWVLLRLFVRRVLHDDNRRLTRLVLALLVVQFILGMTANLWVMIPDYQPWIVFHRAGPILFHTINALLLLNFSTMSLVRAARERRWVALAACGLLGVIVAFASGILFVTGGQNDAFSFAMAMGFLLAFVTFGYRAFAGNGRTTVSAERDRAPRAEGDTVDEVQRPRVDA